MKVVVFLVLAVLALNAAAMSVAKMKKLATDKATEAEAQAEAGADVAPEGMRFRSMFDWNGGTGLQGIKPMMGMDMPAPRTVWRGCLGACNTNPGGHNFATRRALDFVLLKAQANGALGQLVYKVLKGNHAQLWEDKEKQPTAAKMLVFGNFQNEIRVNMDGEGSVAVSLAAKALRAKFGSDREVSLDGTHSKWWTATTGYSSANPIHSMLQEGKPAKPTVYSQGRSYDILVAFAKDHLKTGLDLLRAEKASTTETDNWKKGLRYIGGVLHLIQDSACACTPKHWTVRDWKDVNNCIAGDGHGVVEYVTAAKRYQVTGLSDTTFYDQRLHFHELLDQLYTPNRVLSTEFLARATSRAQINAEYNRLPNALWGDNDPAYDGGNLLIDVIKNVFTSVDSAKVAESLVSAYVRARYVARSALKMPTIQQSIAAKAAAQRR